MIIENVEDSRCFSLLTPITQVANVDIIAWFSERDAVVDCIEKV